MPPHEDYGKTYSPSNGTEGMCFVDKFCMNCIHEKFLHTANDADKKCDIFTDSLLYHYNEPGYPKEWIYDEEGKPTCTAFKKWDWGFGDDPDGFNEPPEMPPDDPNQLLLPFTTNDILKDHKTKENA